MYVFFSCYCDLTKRTNFSFQHFPAFMEGTHYPIVQQHSPVQVLATLNGGNVIETIKTFTNEKIGTKFMAQHVGLKESQVKYIKKKYSIKARNFADISDEELDRLSYQIVQLHPTIGYTMFCGHFAQFGISVQRRRLRASMDRVKLTRNDPPKCAIYRRTYYSEAPLSMGHMDGWLGLGPYGIVVHGAVDGHSKAVVFLKCSTNNRAKTVLNGFLEAVTKWGLFVKMRSDKGVENVAVCDYMLAGRCLEAFLTGKSVHNQPVERFWRDVCQSCCGIFKIKIAKMQETGSLDVGSVTDLYSLHFVVLPLLRKAIDSFTIGWNNHKMRTKKNKSPRQQFIQGICRLTWDGRPHAELYQDADRQQWAKLEAEAIGHFTHDRNTSIKIPKVPELLSYDQQVYLAQQLEQLNVTLDNLTFAFEYAKWFVTQALNE